MGVEGGFAGRGGRGWRPFDSQFDFRVLRFVRGKVVLSDANDLRRVIVIVVSPSRILCTRNRRWRRMAVGIRI